MITFKIVEKTDQGTNILVETKGNAYSVEVGKHTLYFVVHTSKYDTLRLSHYNSGYLAVLDLTEWAGTEAQKVGRALRRIVNRTGVKKFVNVIKAAPEITAGIPDKFDNASIAPEAKAEPVQAGEGDDALCGCVKCRGTGGDGRVGQVRRGNCRPSRKSVNSRVDGFIRGKYEMSTNISYEPSEKELIMLNYYRDLLGRTWKSSILKMWDGRIQSGVAYAPQINSLYRAANRTWLKRFSLDKANQKAAENKTPVAVTFRVVCEGDAFAGSRGIPELVRIFVNAAKRIGGKDDLDALLAIGEGKIADENGNICGHLVIERGKID